MRIRGLEGKEGETLLFYKMVRKGWSLRRWHLRIDMSEVKECLWKKMLKALGWMFPAHSESRRGAGGAEVSKGESHVQPCRPHTDSGTMWDRKWLSIREIKHITEEYRHKITYRNLSFIRFSSFMMKISQVFQNGHIPYVVIVGVHSIMTVLFLQWFKGCFVVNLSEELT